MYTERKDVSSISVLTRNGNGSYGTEERQRNGGNQALPRRTADPVTYIVIDDSLSEQQPCTQQLPQASVRRCWQTVCGHLLQ